MKRVISIGLPSLLVVSLLGCNGPGKLESKIVDHIQTCSHAATCRFAISDVTPFDWDKFYVFDYGVSLKDRERALGTKDEGFQEFHPQLVFLKDGRIVYQESEQPDVENPNEDEVIFDIPNDRNLKFYAPTAVFSVTEDHAESGRYFLLKQLQ